MPMEVIQHVTQLGHEQGMPDPLTFADHHESEIEDHFDEVDDDDEESYHPPPLDDDEIDNDIYNHNDFISDGFHDDDDDQHDMPYNAPETNIRDELPPSMDVLKDDKNARVLSLT